ncbi:hypothetical protein XA68_14050 [Ophiocordyceps unilateralis]|uniref:Pentacotripeptide-repeat region of PRORP domain-containing protein n=1 Tax=Ophiocordyceps unilateralis TaxID=268505 RepID=A0A2A9PBD1_OPHUN|nr:hypothetical protein XA68_14050 [Ophiocordyceps unilateralis]
MLERTAAGLESCNLQRLVATRSPRSGRRLHLAFWQHGAAALELFGQSTVPRRFANSAVLSPSPSSFRHSSLPGLLGRRHLVLSDAQSVASSRRRYFSSNNGPAARASRTPVRRKKKSGEGNTATKKDVVSAVESRTATGPPSLNPSTASPAAVLGGQKEASGDETSAPTSPAVGPTSIFSVSGDAATRRQAVDGGASDADHTATLSGPRDKASETPAIGEAAVGDASQGDDAKQGPTRKASKTRSRKSSRSRAAESTAKDAAGNGDGVKTVGRITKATKNKKSKTPAAEEAGVKDTARTSPPTDISIPETSEAKASEVPKEQNSGASDAASATRQNSAADAPILVLETVEKEEADAGNTAPDSGIKLSQSFAIPRQEADELPNVEPAVGATESENLTSGDADAANKAPDPKIGLSQSLAIPQVEADELANTEPASSIGLSKTCATEEADSGDESPTVEMETLPVDTEMANGDSMDSSKTAAMRETSDSYDTTSHPIQVAGETDDTAGLPSRRTDPDGSNEVQVSPEQGAKSSPNQLQADSELVLVKAGDLVAAENDDKDGLAQKGRVGGVEQKIAHSIRNQDWPMLLKLWKDYFMLHDANAAADGCPWPESEDIPDLAEPYLLFERYLETQVADEIRTINVDALLALRRKLAETSLNQACAPLLATVILEVWGDVDLYERYIFLMLDRWALRRETRNGLTRLNDIYKAYRLLPDAKPSPALLHAMFPFCAPRTGPSNVPMVENLYRDWHKTWGGFDEQAFRDFLDFYAEEGDIAAVRYIWARYVNRFPEALKLPGTFRSLVMAYAQRGVPEKAEREVRLMTERYNVQPDTELWNAVLRSYMRVENSEVMHHCMDLINAAGGPNSTSYAIFLSLTAKRGDLEAAISLYNQSQQRGIPVTAEMMRGLVLAYCHNDRLLAAERICGELSQRGLADSEVWNQVIKFNGIKGRLDKCQELLRIMDSFGIEWNDHTYLELLSAMVKVRQLLPAWTFLKKAIDQKLFVVRDEHFEIIMSGAGRNKIFDLVGSIASQMLRTRPGPLSFNALALLAEASFAKAPTSQRTLEICQQLVPALQALVPKEESLKELGSEPPKGQVGSIKELKRRTVHAERAVKVFVEMRDFKTAELLINTYISIFPQFGGPKMLPPKLAATVMLGYLKEKRYKRALNVWEKAWKSALTLYRDAKGLAYPSYRYHLTMPLYTAVSVLRDAGDSAELINVVQQAQAVGFRLSRQTWNLAIDALVTLGKWELAMSWCETVLMPGWRGWYDDLSTAQKLSKNTDSHLLAPSKTTVFSLQAQWLKTRKLAAWSGEVSNRLKQLERDHPMLHYAFITNDVTRLPAAWTLPKTQNLTQAIKEMLKPLTYRELNAIKTALLRQLRILGMREDPEREKDRHRHRHRRAYTGPYSSPFHVVVGGDERDGVRTKAFTPFELELLDVELQRRITEMADSFAKRSLSSWPAPLEALATTSSLSTMAAQLG